MVKAKVYVNPRVYSDAEEGFLPPFQKCISETIDIPCRRTKSTMRETDLKRPSEQQFPVERVRSIHPVA